MEGTLHGMSSSPKSGIMSLPTLASCTLTLRLISQLKFCNKFDNYVFSTIESVLASACRKLRTDSMLSLFLCVFREHVNL